MHHLARRTSLVGRQPEALRRRSREEGRGSEEERMKENGRGRVEGAEQQRGIERKVKRECGTILGWGG